MYMICTMHMCAYVTPKYIHYVHALFNTYTHAHAGSLMRHSSAEKWERTKRYMFNHLTGGLNQYPKVMFSCFSKACMAPTGRLTMAYSHLGLDGAEWIPGGEQ